MTNVDELKNSLKVSNSRIVPAIAPVFWRCSAGVRVRILSKSLRDISKSARLLATSMNRARKLLIKKSKPNAITTPILNAISDSKAPFGIIRSYTVIVNSEVVNERKFDTIAAIITWTYSHLLFRNALKNQWPERSSFSRLFSSFARIT